MKVAILGGGFAGLTAAYYLREKGHEVTIFEREKVLGGLAVGFKQPGWDWPLEKAYHHLFATDSSILSLAKDVGFNGIFFQSPETASFYNVSSTPEGKKGEKTENYRIYPVDTPQGFIAFPLLPFFVKLRAGIVVAALKLLPFLPLFEKMTCEVFFSKTMGKQAWDMIFGELMRKKFGKYAGNVLASFIWARIKVRTKSLGYIRGGFQTFFDHLEKVESDMKIKINKGTEVMKILKENEQYSIKYVDKKGVQKDSVFDVVISTLPSPILAKVAGTIFPKTYFERFKKLHYLNAVVIILESTNPLLESSYWLNICDPAIPLMFVGQHTNFIDKKHYGNKHLAYVGWYVDASDPLWTMNDQEIIKFLTPHFNKINANFDISKTKTYLFKAPFAQPIFDTDFINNKPDYITPLKNFYIANLDMTYPNDRGTNYAVAIGKKSS